MKKILFFLISFLMISFVTNGQTLNNPKDTSGYYIVKWDCAKGTFAASNDIEADETFTFAVDVTGTPFEEWLKATPTAAGATRSIAINKWTNFGDVSGGTNRLKNIKGNIFGATWNIIQMASTMKVDKATGKDSVVYIYGQVFGFEFTDDNPGANWWMWPSGVAAGTAIDPGKGSIFKTLPYTGTKTSPEFYSDEYEGGLFLSNNAVEKGYTVPCASGPVSVPQMSNDSEVIGHEYYNIVGVKLLVEPQQGLYIHKILKANGTSKVEKVFKR